MGRNDLMGRAGERSPWSQYMMAGEGRGGREFAASVLTGLFQRVPEGRFPSGVRRELASLARERDPEIFWEGMLALGGRLEGQDRPELAGALYALVANPSAGTIGPDARTQDRARQRLAALTGQGGLGGRAEVLLRNLSREATDPVALLGMVAGSTIYSAARATLLSRLLTSPTATWATRGLGARVLASTTAFALEVPAFWGTTKALRTWTSEGEVSWALSDNLRELSGLGLGLGGLKLFGGLALSLPGNLGSRAWVRQTAMFGGILAGHRLEVAAGLRPHQDGGATLIDSLALLLQFNVAGRLTQQFFGGYLGSLQRDLELRSRGMERPLESRRLFPEFAEALPVGVGGGRKASPRVVSLDRPLQMSMVRDGGSVPPNSLGSFFSEVAAKARGKELRQAKDLLFELYHRVTGFRPTEVFLRYQRSNDPEEWKSLIDMLGALVQEKPKAAQALEADPDFLKFREDWQSRPHFTSVEQVPVSIVPGTARAYQINQQVQDLQRALFREPNLRGWRAFANQASNLAKRERKKIFEMREVSLPDGGRAFVGNWRSWGMTVRFNAREILAGPIEIQPSFSPETLAERMGRLSRALPPEPPPPPTAPESTNGGAALSAPAILTHIRHLAPLDSENPTEYALRLLRISTEGPEASLEVAHALIERLESLGPAEFTRQTVERMVPLTQATEEGTSILARRYPVPGLKEPLTIVSLPSTFLPEQWSRVFAEGVARDFQAHRQPVARALEIGSGTGWMSILLAKLGAAQEILGVDMNPHAAVVGRLNALLNGVSGVRFMESDLLSQVPGDFLVDLIVACIPQVPSAGAIQNLRAQADYYASQNQFMDRFGLGLVDRALEQAKGRLTPSGRVLFNLGGRPGRDMLEEMLVRRGFHPTVRFSQMIYQDSRTDFSELARREESLGHRFEFFLDDPSVPISAREAVGKRGVRHLLYLMEGRPYSAMLRGHLEEVLNKEQLWGYTPDPGTEHGPLRQSLAEELSRMWGARLHPDTLFLSPGAAPFIESWLRLTLRPEGRLLLVGEAEGRVQPILGNFSGIRKVQNDPTLSEAGRSLEREPFDAVLVQMPREKSPARDEIRNFLAAATSRQAYVLLVEPYPRRAADGSNPWTEVLGGKESLPVLPETAILTPIDERLATPALPLAVGIMANGAFYRRLLHYADTTYSRASLPIQEAYHRFIKELSAQQLQTVTPSAEIQPIAMDFWPRSPWVDTLERSPAFHSSPQASHPDPIDMNFGESEYRLPVNLRHAVSDAWVFPSEGLNRRAREAVVRYLEESRGVTYQPEQVVLGMGVQPLLVAALRALRGQVGGESLRTFVPEPSYGIYFPTVEVAGAELHPVPTRPDRGFLLDMVGLKSGRHALRSAQPLPSAILINQPINPAGRYYSEAVFRELLEYIHKSGDFLLLDDVFGQLRFKNHKAPGQSQWAMARGILGSNLIGFGGLSKEFASGGLRFGFAVTENPDLAQAMAAHTVWRPDRVAQAAALEILPQWRELLPRHIDYLGHRMLQITGFFRQKNIPFTSVEGGYAVFADLRGILGRNFVAVGRPPERITSENLHEILLREAGIKIHGDRWARVSGHYRFVFSIERLDEALERLKKFFRSVR